MRKFIRIYENEEMFDKILSTCNINMDISSWDYSSDIHSNYNYNARPLTRKCTDYPVVGWLVYREWEDGDETYIAMKEEELEN